MTATEAIARPRKFVRRKHKALATEASCVHELRRHLAALEGMPRTLTSAQKLDDFPTALAGRRDVVASTQNRAFNAIACFCKDVLGIPFAPRGRAPRQLAGSLASGADRSRNPRPAANRPEKATLNRLGPRVFGPGRRP